MANAFISHQQLEQMIAQNEVDLTEAMKYCPEAVRNIQVKNVTEAINSGDQGKLSVLAQQIPNMQNLVSAIQNQQHLQRLKKVIPLINQIDNKKEKGKTLSPDETNHLAQKSAWVDWAKNQYPQVFEKSENTNVNRLQITPENESRQNVTPTVNASNAQKIPQQKQPTVNTSNAQTMPQQKQQTVNASNAQTIPQQKQQTVNAPETQTIPLQQPKVFPSEEKPLSPEEINAEVNKGIEIQSALKEGITEPDKQAADLADVKEAFNVRESNGNNGYFDKVPVNKDDLKTIDSSKIFEKGLSRLEKIGSGKNPDELVMQVMELALLAPMDMMTEWLNQISANMKENNKIRQSKRNEFIESNLKSNNLSMPKLAAILSHDTQEWLLNDPEYKKLSPNGPYSKYEQALKEKRDFAAELPKNGNGTINFEKMSRAQKKRYTTYMTHYAQVPPFKNYAYEVTGISLMGKELKEMATQAAKMKTVQVAQHQQPAPQPNTVAPQPNAVTPQPNTATPQPNTAAPKPNTAAPQPSAAAPQPSAAAPKMAQTSEKAKLRDEALQSVKLEPLEKVTVTGTPKNPVIKLSDGTKMPVTNANKDALTEETKRLEAKKRKIEEEQAQLNRRQRDLSSARTGRQSINNMPTNTRNNNSRGS